MLHAPLWWYLWLGTVLVFGLASLLTRRGGRQPHGSERPVPGHLAASNIHWMQLPDRNGGVEISDEVECTGREQQAMADALCAGRYTMALASHDPSFSPDAPVSPFDPGGSTHLGE